MPQGNSFLGADKVANTLIAFNTRFNKAIAEISNKVDPIWADLATPIKSETQTEQYNWMGDVPAFTEWVDTRKLAKLRNFKYSLDNKNWANGLQVDKNDIDDDRLGMYSERIATLAEKAMTHKVTLLVQKLIAGFTDAGPDGSTFIGASHQVDVEASQSNLLSGNPALDVTPFNNAYAQMESFKDENGNPIYVSPTDLVCGPSNRAKGESILKAQTLASGASNVNFNKVKLRIAPTLTGAYANYWFLCDLGHAMKPLLFQDRQPPQFTSVVALDSSEVFMKRMLMFGADARYNAGFGMWQFVVGSTGS